jgi:hypothetical protein
MCPCFYIRDGLEERESEELLLISIRVVALHF